MKVYEKTYDYEIEFNEKLAKAVKDKGIGSPEANLLSAQAEASRRTRLYVESVHTMQTSTNALDIAVVNQWKTDGYNPLDTNIIKDMQTDIINQSNIAQIKALYENDNSKYALAMNSVTSMKQKALALTNVNRDGAVSTTEIATLLVDAAANGNKVDGINLDVIKAALAANGVTSTQITKVEILIDQIDTNNDGQMSFEESLLAFNNFNKSQGRAAFNDMMNVLAATKVDKTTNPSAFTTIGTESFFTGDYSTQDRAVLSTFLASNGRYVHTTKEKFEALDAFYNNAGNTIQQRSDWRDYQYANWAQSESAGDISQDNSLAWSFKNGTNVSGFLKQIQDMTSSRTEYMMDILEEGNRTQGSGWWNDRSLSYFKLIRNESNVFLVGQRGGTQQDLRLMDMICEAVQISYADIGNYHTGINVNLDGVRDNVSGADKVELKYFADNVKSFGTTDIRYDANLVNQANQQYHAMWGLRAGLFNNIKTISEPEVKLIENKFGDLMDIGDQMEAYLLQNKALGTGARETDQYRALEEQWFNNYDLINGIIRGDRSIDKAVAALGGIKTDGSITQANVGNLVRNLQSSIINGTDDVALDFNSDGNVDSADYDALRMVIGDRRNESAFDALMTQDSLNLSKLAMYSGLAKNTTNVNASNQAIYSQLENYYADQSEINNYIATNTADSSFASVAEKQRFTELANQLDELNEAVEFDLRTKLFKNTPATINATLKAKADKASNEMVLLSLGLTKEDSAAVAATLGSKITEALDEETETMVRLAAELKKENKISQEQLTAISKSIIEGVAIDPNINDSAKLKKLIEYMAIGANSNELTAYINLAGNNAPTEKLNLLDNYIKGAGLPNSNDENKFLSYLINETNIDIAKTYRDLVEGNDPNKATKLSVLEDLAANNETDKLNDTQEDVFLDLLKTEGNIKIAQTYSDILNGNETDAVKNAKIALITTLAANNATDQLSDTQEDVFLDLLKTEGNIKIAQTYSDILNGNETDAVKNAKIDLIVQLAANNTTDKLSDTQEDTFLDLLKTEGNIKIAQTYSDILNGNETDAVKNAKIALIATLAANNATDQLSDTQEDVFLDLLRTEGNIKIAQTYSDILNGNETDAVKNAKIALITTLAANNATDQLSDTQENVFLDLLRTQGNIKIAQTYAGIINQGGNQDSIRYLEDYSNRNLNISLTPSQENQMLDYLGGSTNSNIAKSYVNFIQANAASTDLNILNDIYLKSRYINEAIRPNDLTFFRTLENLATRGVNIDPPMFLEYLDTTISFSDINQVVARIATYVETSTSSTKAQDARLLSRDLLKIMADPVKYDLGTLYANDNAKLVFKDILGLQLRELGKLNQSDLQVIESINYANERLASINADLDPVTGGLNPTQRGLYGAFARTFPVGQTPTNAQSIAAVDLITRGGNFGSNLAFLTNYGKFVSSGDTTSANNLIEIANYFGSRPDYAVNISRFRNTNLDAKSISTAKEIIDFTRILEAQNSPDLTNLILTTNRDFLIDTILRRVDNIFNSATEGDLTRDFFQSLKETFNEKPDSINNRDYSTFARNAISKFSNDHIRFNGVLYSSSFTNVLVRDIGRGSPGIYANDGIAQMQIDVFEGMLSFYQNQIQQENAKPQPDTSKIGQWQTQINSHNAAINALRSTL
ncbi:MAG: hypothetical protein ACKO3R_06080 [bacterium]